jgi:hypothetical protein
MMITELPDKTTLHIWKLVIREDFVSVWLVALEMQKIKCIKAFPYIGAS